MATLASVAGKDQLRGVVTDLILRCAARQLIAGIAIGDERDTIGDVDDKRTARQIRLRRADPGLGPLPRPGKWPQLLATFAPDGQIAVSWFSGSFREFVDRCTQSFNAGQRSKHHIFPVARARRRRARAWPRPIS